MSRSWSSSFNVLEHWCKWIVQAAHLMTWALLVVVTCIALWLVLQRGGKDIGYVIAHAILSSWEAAERSGHVRVIGFHRRRFCHSVLGALMRHCTCIVAISDS